jgi:NAD-dependent dihydropyrimidine dehydrogenase PreA subunit
MDLLRDVERKKFMQEFVKFAVEEGRGLPAKMEKLRRAPWIVQWYVKRRQLRWMKKMHYGQIVPLEDLEAIFEITNSIVLLPCVCRKAILGTSPAFCMAVSTIPILYDLITKEFVTLASKAGYFSGPEAASVEKLTKESAIKLLRDFEGNGLVHSVWTFKTPFIGGLCNCDRSGCLAMRALECGLGAFFRAEYIAEVNKDLCKGCRNCIKQCQFGAMYFDPTNRKVLIAKEKCFGCGICRVACTQKAITLAPRHEGFEAISG